METKKKHRAKAQEQVLSLVLISVHCDLIRARRQSRATTRSVSFLFVFYTPSPSCHSFAAIVVPFHRLQKKNREGKKNKQKTDPTNQPSIEQDAHKQKTRRATLAGFVGSAAAAALIVVVIWLLLLLLPTRAISCARSSRSCTTIAKPIRSIRKPFGGCLLLVANGGAASDEKKTSFKSKRIASAFQNGGRYDHFFSLFFLFPKDVFLAQLWKTLMQEGKYVFFCFFFKDWIISFSNGTSELKRYSAGLIDWGLDYTGYV